MFKRLFFLLIVGMLAFSYAEEKHNLSNPDMLINKIIENQDFCVKDIDQDKIYLYEDNIYPTEHGIFLILNDQNRSVRITDLHSDDHGCFIKYSSIKQDILGGKTDIFPKCPGCKRRYFLKCDNPNCPLKK